jgi:hypothetical protein
VVRNKFPSFRRAGRASTSYKRLTSLCFSSHLESFSLYLDCSTVLRKVHGARKTVVILNSGPAICLILTSMILIPFWFSFLPYEPNIYFTAFFTKLSTEFIIFLLLSFAFAVPSPFCKGEQLQACAQLGALVNRAKVLSRHIIP